MIKRIAHQNGSTGRIVTSTLWNSFVAVVDVSHVPMPNGRDVAPSANEASAVTGRVMLGSGLRSCHQKFAAGVVVERCLGNVTTAGGIEDLYGANQADDAPVSVGAAEIVVGVGFSQHRHAVGGKLSHFVRQTVGSVQDIIDRGAFAIVICVVNVCLYRPRILLISQVGVILSPGDRSPFLSCAARPIFSAGG